MVGRGLLVEAPFIDLGGKTESGLQKQPQLNDFCPEICSKATHAVKHTGAQVHTTSVPGLFGAPYE